MTTILESTCESVANEVRARFEETKAGLAVYWVAIQSNRADYADRLQDLLQDYPLGVVVLRRAGLFENANSVMADIATLVTDARATLEKAFSVHAGSVRWGVVVISRAPMTISQSSSPVELPEWFPDLGGMEVHSSIEDITWQSRTTLDDPDIGLPRLHRRLYDSEGALLRRLSQVNDSSPEDQQAFFELVKKADESSMSCALRLALEEWRHVPNPDSYRPSARYGRAFVARLWSKTGITKPRFIVNDLVKPMAVALKLDTKILADVSVPDSLIALLSRPSGTSAELHDQRFVDSMVWSVAASFRLLTASHHADAYGRFPFPLLYSVNHELRATLANYEQVLNLHE